MKRLILVPCVAVGISILGLTSAGSATARSTPGVGTHHATVHVINLHKAYKARLGDTTPGQIAGVVYSLGHAPIHGRGGNSCAEPYCPVYYQGGLVQHSPRVYLLLWGPNWSSDPNQAATASYLGNFYSGLGVESGTFPDNWSPITSQYGDTTGSPTFNGSVYEGAFQDTSTPPLGVDATGLATEADAFASQQGITDLTDAQIVIATQSGTCPAGFVASTCPSQYRGVECGWHDSSNEPFTNLPYLLDAGTACGEDFVNSNGTYDGFSVVGGHEYAETITDPYPFTGWQDPNDQSSGEIADKCAWSSRSSDVPLSTGSFAMQPLWSNFGNECVMSVQTTGDITLDSPGAQSDYQEVKGISLQIIGTSRYGFQLAWSASGLPSGLAINTSSGLISGQVTGVPGTYSVTVSVSDPRTSPPATVTFNWIVNADVGSLITNKGSGLCLNDSHWVTTPGNEIFLWKCGGSAAEDFSHPTNGGELIVFGQCMTDPHPSGSGGQLEVIDPCAGKSTQEYYRNGKGEYIVNKLCLTDPANATQNGTPVVLEPCTGASDQLWVGS
jgi:Ricin-type beta-trefoil lectin domain/Putative Ig domain